MRKLFAWAAAGTAFFFLIVTFWKREEAVPLDEPKPAVLGEGRSPVLPGAEPARKREPASAPMLSLHDRPLLEKEKEAIASLLSLMAQRDALGKSPGALYRAMGKAGLQPVAGRDSNEFTGTLTLVRTDNALPGTRYFHAQVFGDEASGTHMQHLSFEIRPGADSMATALELVRESHPGLGEPIQQQEGYTLWRLAPGKVVSVKRIGEEDIGSSYFNARSKEDVGAVWVVSEDEPLHGETGHL